MMGFTQSYIITSAVVHAGKDRAGHQQATLASPNGWYLTDDAVLPLLWDADAAGREQALQARDIGRLCDYPKIRDLLNGYCVICGKTLFSYREMLQHVSQIHPTYLSDLGTCYHHWQESLKGQMTPCCFCGMTHQHFVDQRCIVPHECPAILQMALADLYYHRELQGFDSRFTPMPGDPSEHSLLDALMALEPTPGL